MSDNDEFEDTFYDDENDEELDGYEIDEENDEENDDLIDYEFIDDRIVSENEEDNLPEDDELFSIPCSVCGELIDMREAKYIDGEAQHISGCKNG